LITYYFSEYNKLNNVTGKEVAKFAKLKLENVLLQLEEFKQGHFDIALRECFHKIDEMLEEEVIVFIIIILLF
jgi:hypothetical protein